MRVLHVIHQGAEVRLEKGMLAVWAEGERVGLARIPLLEALVLHGGVHITTAALSRLIAEGVDCVYLAQNGRFKARLETLASPAAARRVRQAFVAAQPGGRLRPAKAIVRNKAAAQLRVLRALRLETPARLLWAAGGLGTAATLAEAQGLEGYASRLYFAALKGALPPGLTGWTRQRRPPPDGVNALLGYAYAILQSRVHSAVAVVGLDPYIGFLHPPGRGRPSLVLDMVEEFRPLVAEYTCWRLLRRLGDSGWWTVEDGSARLTDEAKRALIEAVEARLSSYTVHAATNSRVTLERAIELQVRDFAAGLEGDWRRYRPLRGGVM